MFSLCVCVHVHVCLCVCRYACMWTQRTTLNVLHIVLAKVFLPRTEVQVFVIMSSWLLSFEMRLPNPCSKGKHFTAWTVSQASEGRPVRSPNSEIPVLEGLLSGFTVPEQKITAPCGPASKIISKWFPLYHAFLLQCAKFSLWVQHNEALYVDSNTRLRRQWDFFLYSSSASLRQITLSGTCCHAVLI